ncbi:MAG: hypothetical protein LIP05_00895, partial [Tannerellaceae bacterium]|nr:hypothetical protein [Tannerellaceae bacterium]
PPPPPPPTPHTTPTDRSLPPTPSPAPLLVYMTSSPGVHEDTIRLIQRYVEQAKTENPIPYTPSSVAFNYQTPDTNPSLPDYIPTFERWKKRYTIPQKQEGHYAVLLPVQQGTITPDTVEKLAVFAAGFGNDVIRFYYPPAYSIPEYSGSLSPGCMAVIPGTGI